jgi:transposase
MEVEDHYAMLLGINSPWEITTVDLKLDQQQVDIEIEYTASDGQCPECGAACPKHDDRQLRTWRHLDTMQFTTLLHCQLPRVKCSQHGAVSVTAPWAGKGSRFTLMFEAFAIRVLKAARSVEEARKLLNLNWHQVETIKKRAVARGLARRKDTVIPYIGIDEKQFRKGHNYISSLVDLDGGRVLDVVEERTEKATKTLLDKALSTNQQAQVIAVALDMWKAFDNAVSEKMPQADIVHDRFHISQHLNESVDKVRRQENKELNSEGDNRLKGTKFQWLENAENLHEKHRESFDELRNWELKVSRAWAIKESFRHFWDYRYGGCTERYFNDWYSWAFRSQLQPVKEKARMIKTSLPNILTYFKHGISTL